MQDKRYLLLSFFLTNSTKMKIIIEKGDSEEKIMIAKALLVNGLVSAIERATISNQKVHKSDDEVAKAVIEVAEYFGVSTQWTAVYRVLVDFCGWNSDIVAFCNRINTLLIDVHLHHPCDYQAIQKPLSQHSILRKDFQEWKKYKVPANNRVFPRQLFIANKLLNLLSINA